VRRLACRWVSIFALCALLGACGVATRLTYESADAVVLLAANRYLNLEGDQWKVARGAIQRFHAWHRQAELSRYALLLQNAAGRVRRGLTRDDVEWAILNVRVRYAAAVDAAVGEGAPVLRTLSTRNIAHLERRFAADDRKRAGALAGDPAKRDRARVEAIAKRVAEWTGPLSGEQQELIRRFVLATVDHPRHAREHRQRKQRELVALLEPAGDGARETPTADEWRSFFLSWEAEQPARERDYHARFVPFVLALDRSLSAGQRAHVIERLGGYAEDFRWLSRRS
jgi:hypothetical protein